MSKIKGIGSIEGPLEVEDVTDATSTTSASIQTDGGMAAVKKIVAGEGIYLGGVAAANLLDDYEEDGTFTPILTGATSGTFNGEGFYTKIGDIVYCVIRFSGITTATKPIGSYTITGMPFTSASLGSSFHVGLSQTERITMLATGSLYLRMGPSTTIATIIESQSNGLSVVMSDANFLSGSTMFVNASIMYKV